MLHHLSVKGFNLAVATTICLGLGAARTLPVQAAVLTNSARDRQTLEYPTLNFEFSPLTSQPATSSQPYATTITSGNVLSANSSSTGAAPAKGAADNKEEEDSDSALEGFFLLAFFSMLLILIANLLSGGEGSTQTTQQALPQTPLANPGGGTPLNPSAPGTSTPVPTPALLPGLLALSLKLLRQKKSDSQPALNAEGAR
jgi:hypothetical protein